MSRSRKKRQPLFGDPLSPLPGGPVGLGRAVRRVAVGSGLGGVQEGGLLVLLGDVLELLVLGLGALVLGDVEGDVAVGDAEDEEQPEEVEGLEGGQQGDGDVLADPALVLARLPVELEGADGPVLGDQRPEDAEVEVVSQVDPGAHEHDHVGSDEGVVDVIERLGGLKGRSRVSKQVPSHSPWGGGGGISLLEIASNRLTARKKSLMS